MTAEKVTITGNTYPVKDAIKNLGGKWNPDRKGWDVPANKAEYAKKLVASAPKTTTRPRSRGSRGGGNGCRNGQCYCNACSSGSECLCRCPCGFGG